MAVLEAEAKKLSEEAEREKREAEEAGQELEVAEQAEELAVPEALVTPATSETEVTEEERARSIAIFHAMDEDGGGTVDIDELSTAFSVLERSDVEVTPRPEPPH